MGYGDHWRDQSKCRTLSPAQTDGLFFPGNGGKPKKADSFCADCPVLSKCLMEAIEKKLEGFWAGTTDAQRKAMAKIHGIRINPIVDNLPSEPDRDRRVVYRKIIVVEDNYKYLEEIEPKEDELLELEQVIS